MLRAGHLCASERAFAGDAGKYTSVSTYRNFGEVTFNLANWRFCGKSPNLNPPILFYALSLYAEELSIAKF